jgi:hypothetical protein
MLFECVIRSLPIVVIEPRQTLQPAQLAHRRAMKYCASIGGKCAQLPLRICGGIAYFTPEEMSRRRLGDAGSFCQLSRAPLLANRRWQVTLQNDGLGKCRCGWHAAAMISRGTIAATRNRLHAGAIVAAGAVVPIPPGRPDNVPGCR